MKHPSLVVVLCIVVVSSAHADGIRFELDLTTRNSTLRLVSENENSGYRSGRGVIFTATQDFIINGAELWTKSTTGLNATFELWEVQKTKGDILVGATLVRSADELLVGNLGFHGTKFDRITLIEKQDYYLQVIYDEAADENWLFDFDQQADPPLDLGPVVVIDGALGGDTQITFGAPFMSLQIVPAPGALFALMGVILFHSRMAYRSPGRRDESVQAHHQPLIS